MGTWDIFIYYALPSSLLWIVGGIAALKSEKNERLAIVCYVGGIAIFMVYILTYWIQINRIPLRTMGETRLFYSLFLSAVGFMIYYRWRLKWILLFSAIISSVFVGINLLKPEIHDSTLPAALQSGWFIPHVTSYMLSYAFFGAATIVAVRNLYFLGKNEREVQMRVIDQLVRIGFGLISIGLFFGAFWAKEAWGDYWSWDPKETWAAITWMGYVTYIHHRYVYAKHRKVSLLLLIFSFLFLQICWYGIKYLPSATSSIHVYS